MGLGDADMKGGWPTLLRDDARVCLKYLADSWGGEAVLVLIGINSID